LVINEKQFCFTYGDGVSDVDITKLIKFHQSHGKDATITATRPPGRYGSINITDSGLVDNFQEKIDGVGSWVNGGFFILSPSVIDRIDGDMTTFENEPLSTLASDGQLAAFKHEGFWQPMDTLREKNLLNNLWDTGVAPWKTW